MPRLESQQGMSLSWGMKAWSTNLWRSWRQSSSVPSWRSKGSNKKLRGRNKPGRKGSAGTRNISR
eukprot:7856541-Lingulodinium_polyedra.AAC.1